MKDYIREFGDDQEGKKFVPVKFEPEVEWGFEPDIKQAPIQEPPQENPARNEETISIEEMRELTTDLVLEFMNMDTQLPKDNELLEEQKIEIEQKIIEYCKRPGILSLSYQDDFNLNESSINAVIDPTNTKNWCYLKQEQIYKLPYSYKTALHEFAAGIWEKNKNLMLEAEGVESNEEYIQQLKQQARDANKAADARYNEVAHQSTHYMTTNPFEPNVTHTPDARMGHIMALADGQYKMLKKKAVDLEQKVRRLERRVKR